MRTTTLQIRFNSPAFLGNADQNGQWRTPPIKALLRQWWRVAFAMQNGFRVRENEMRHFEGRLFGHAWLDDDVDETGAKVHARRGAVRIRLARWDLGRLKTWEGVEQRTVHHPEAKRAVGPHAYLGFGPLLVEQNQTRLKRNAAIQADESTILSLAYPEEDSPLIEHALWLMDRYGTLGGRSRNGWGSFSLCTAQGGPALAGRVPLRPWRDCLGLDWPHALGSDAKGAPLIWQTSPNDDWRSLMRTLADIKIRLRTTAFEFPRERPNGEIHDRHWLSYPVTTHKVRAWDRENLRLPNSLRFKLRPISQTARVGVIFHVPCLPSATFRPDRQTIESVWQRVHQFLDNRQDLTRIPE